MNLTIGVIIGMVAHEAFHIFLAIGGFALVKKLIGKHICCNHNHKKEEKQEETTKGEM